MVHYLIKYLFFRGMIIYRRYYDGRNFIKEDRNENIYFQERGFRVVTQE